MGNESHTDKKEREKRRPRQRQSTCTGHTAHLPYPVSHSVHAAAADGNRCKHAPAAASCALESAPCVGYKDDRSLRRSHDNDAWTGQSFRSYACTRGTAARADREFSVMLYFSINLQHTHNDLLIGSPVAGRHLICQHAAQCLSPGTRIAAHRLAKAVHAVQYHLGRVRICATRRIAALPHMHHLNAAKRLRERESISAWHA